MSVKLLTEHHFEFLSLKGGCTESTHVKMPHCWKSHVTAHIRCTLYMYNQRHNTYFSGHGTGKQVNLGTELTRNHFDWEFPRFPLDSYKFISRLHTLYSYLSHNYLNGSKTKNELVWRIKITRNLSKSKIYE